MTCEKCGETIEPHEPDIRYRPGDGKTRYDYHAWCFEMEVNGDFNSIP
jgi:Fe2+ or Zn2+ uptake regulation protein